MRKFWDYRGEDQPSEFRFPSVFQDFEQFLVEFLIVSITFYVEFLYQIAQILENRILSTNWALRGPCHLKDIGDLSFELLLVGELVRKESLNDMLEQLLNRVPLNFLLKVSDSLLNDRIYDLQSSRWTNKERDLRQVPA